MGYTHYWRQKSAPTEEQWNNICTDFNKLCFGPFLDKPFPIQRESDDSDRPLVSDNLIVFNGIGSDAHETMHFARNALGFGFCKTKKKPYNMVVVLLLILAYNLAEDVWLITSDGDQDDWLPVLDWMNSIGTGYYQMPATISATYQNENQDI